MAAHRHWSLLVTARAGAGNKVAVAEVAMRSIVAGANIATGGTAGGTNNAGHPPANAFDGNGSTEWRDGETAAIRVRLSYDFGAPVNVVEIVVTTPGAASAYNGATFGPACCWVQWSDDGVTWRYGGPASDLSSLGNAASMTIGEVSDIAPGGRIVNAPLRLATSAPSGLSAGRRTLDLLRYDPVDGGPFRLAGFVKIDGTPPVPVRRRVRVFDVISGRLVRAGWSGLDGSVAFEKLRLAEYLLVSDDYTRTYNAVTADKVVPEL